MSRVAYEFSDIGSRIRQEMRVTDFACRCCQKARKPLGKIAQLALKTMDSISFIRVFK